MFLYQTYVWIELLNAKMKMNKPLVSIIVPIYNSEKYISLCLESIISQTYKNLEIILVDDVSIDKSFSICESYQKIHSNVFIFKNIENKGAAYSRNVGLKHSKGELICFIDSDDYVSPNMIDNMVSALIANKTDVCCCGRFDVINGTVKKGLCPKKNEVINGIEMLNRCFLYEDVDFSPCDKIYRKELWKDSLFPVGRVCEDVFALYNLFIKCSDVCLIDKPLYYYNHHDGSASQDAFNKNTFDFEYYTKIIYSDVMANHPKLLPNARIYRMKSLLYTVSYVGKIKKSTYSKYKERLYSYKNELKEYKRYMTFRQYCIFFAYVTHLARPYYYLMRLFEK